MSRIPAKALSSPLNTNSQNLIRLTRMPANCAASGCSPIATIARPAGVRCSTTPKITASTMKISSDQDSCVPGTEFAPMFVSHVGNCGSPIPGITFDPSITSARPRYSVKVPIVTAMDGSPNRATSTPFSAPPTTPTAKATRKHGQIPQP